MTEQAVTFPSAGLKLSGVVHIPSGMRPGERRAAFIVLHGFGSNKTSSNTMQPTKVLGELGYVVLRFDMRGCGESEGEFGRVICLEQVEDTRSALTFLAGHPAVDPERIGVIGSSFGGAVAVYTGGVDERVAAVVSNGGWGDGERKFRGQHPGEPHRGRVGNRGDGAGVWAVRAAQPDRHHPRDHAVHGDHRAAVRRQAVRAVRRGARPEPAPHAEHLPRLLTEFRQ